MSRRGKHNPLRRIVNGWLVEQRPNSFAEQFMYEVIALNEDGFRVKTHGFQTKSEAERFAYEHDLPQGAVASK